MPTGFKDRVQFRVGTLPVGLFVKILKCHSGYMSWPSFYCRFNHAMLGRCYKLWSSSLWSLLHSPFLSLLGPKICPRILFLNTFTLHSSFNLRGHVPQPYSSTGNITVLYILIFKFKGQTPQPYGILILFRITWVLFKLPTTRCTIKSMALVSGISNASWAN